MHIDFELFTAFSCTGSPKTEQGGDNQARHVASKPLKPSLIFDLTILQRPSSPKGFRAPPKLVSSALSLIAVYLLRLAAARAITAPLV